MLAPCQIDCSVASATLPPTIAEREAYREKVKNTTLAILAVRFVYGFAAPASPSIQLKSEMAEWVRDSGKASWKQAWYGLLEKMWMYSLEDIQLCLDRGAIGEYGTLFNRIDPATILAWFPKYDAQRQIAVEALNQEQQKQNNIYEMFQHPQVVDAIQQAADKLKIAEAPAQDVKRATPSRLEQMLMDEYDCLPTWDNDMRFRVYNNRPYQFTEYRKERYRELIEQQNEY